MLRQLLNKLLSKVSGSHNRSYRSSDDYGKHRQEHKDVRHNQYGNSHYKKKRSSSSYSS
jgi:Zn-finger nucleic acid-binding protein